MHMHLLHVGTHAHATAPYTFDNCTRSGSPHNVLHSSSYYEFMMSYKLIQPAVNIGIGIGTADLMANVIVYLQYRQIVV